MCETRHGGQSCSSARAVASSVIESVDDAAGQALRAAAATFFGPCATQIRGCALSVCGGNAGDARIGAASQDPPARIEHAADVFADAAEADQLEQFVARDEAVAVEDRSPRRSG